MQSRLKRNADKQAKKQIVSSVIGIIIVFFIFIKFGPAIIGGVGDIVFKIRGEQKDITNITSADNLDAPNLNPLPDASSDGKITVSGKTSYKDGDIEIFVNNSSYQDISVESDGTFKKQDIQLSEGDNVIKARVKRGDKKSDFSNEYIVKFSKSDPKLDISSPSDGQTFTKADQEINVQGKTDNGDNTVTVNGFRAIVQDDGSFSYYLKLNDGDNTISIEAINPSDRKTKKELKVKYQP